MSQDHGPDELPTIPVELPLLEARRRALWGAKWLELARDADQADAATLAGEGLRHLRCAIGALEAGGL